MVAELLECTKLCEQVHIFQVDFYGRHEVGLDVAILDAVFRWDR